MSWLPYFLRPFLLFVEPAAFELVDATLDAREGAAELFLLDFTDLTLSSALFCAFMVLAEGVAVRLGR